MKTLALIFTFWFTHSVEDPMEFCDIVNSVISKEQLGSVVQHESNLLGKCVVVLQTKNIKDKFNVGVGDFACKAGRVVVFSESEIFGHKVEKVIQFDKIRAKGHKVYITYSIIEFYLDGKPGGLKRKILKTKKASLLMTEAGYQ
ncbi:MAG: hypothetical protein ACKO96_28630 [Flammeovirgaceae bacterium]